MNQNHRKRIDFCCEDLVPRINLTRLWPKLLDNNIYNRDDVNIPRWMANFTSTDTVREVYLTTKTRGPSAFANLLRSLRETGHENLANILEGKDKMYQKDNKFIVHTNIAEKILTLGNDQTEKLQLRTEREKDSFWHSIQSNKPLEIALKKATTFFHSPTYENVPRYRMRSKPRGLALIITNILYEFSHNDPRTSAIHDETNLKNLFVQMGFEIVSYRDLTTQQLDDKIKGFSQNEQLQKVDSCFVIISSHGRENENGNTEILGIDYSPDDESRDKRRVFCTNVIDYFTAEACPNLNKKPKVFIFQLCRGTKQQQAVQETRHTIDASIRRVTKTDELIADKWIGKKTIRNYDDTLVVYATMPGYAAFRDNVIGSWFIQILCDVFMNHAYNTHLKDLFDMIDERLGIERDSKDKCQTAIVESRGFKHCFINPGLFEDISSNKT